jgi:hypothetical protein
VKLAGITDGDQLIVYPRFGEPMIRRVVRTTPSKVFIASANAGEIAFHRETGNRVGKDSRGVTSYAVPYSLELAAPIRDAEQRHAAIKVLRHADLTNVPTVRLVAVVRELEIYGARPQ